jgi:hypothetical protein
VGGGRRVTPVVGIAGEPRVTLVEQVVVDVTGVVEPVTVGIDQIVLGDLLQGNPRDVGAPAATNRRA